MKPTEMTFEAINAHVEKADLAAFEKGGIHYLGAPEAAKLAPADILTKLCPIYRVIKPILQGLLAMPFIPAKWKAALTAFMGVLDVVCGVT